MKLLKQRRELKADLGLDNEDDLVILKQDIREVSKNLTRLKADHFEQRIEYIEDNTREASRESNSNALRKWCRARSFKRIGVHKRDYRSLTTEIPSIADWKTSIALPGG